MIVSLFYWTQVSLGSGLGAPVSVRDLFNREMPNVSWLAPRRVGKAVHGMLELEPMFDSDNIGCWAILVRW